MESGPIAGGLAQGVVEKPSHQIVVFPKERTWHRTVELITAISVHQFTEEFMEAVTYRAAAHSLTVHCARGVDD